MRVYVKHDFTAGAPLECVHGSPRACKGLLMHADLTVQRGLAGMHLALTNI